MPPDKLRICPTAMQPWSPEPVPAASPSADLERYVTAVAPADEAWASFLGGDTPFAVGGPAKSRQHR